MTPGEVVQRFADAMRGGRYEEAAGYFSDAHLALIGTQAEEVFEPPFRPTIDSLMAENPEMTWIEAQDQVSFYEEFLGRDPVHEPELAGVRSLEELRGLSPEGVGARWLEASDPGAHHRAAIDQLIERHPGFRAQLARQREDQSRIWDIDILGAVTHPDTAFVIWQESRGGGEEIGQVIPPIVAVLHRDGNSWKLAADPRPHAGPMSYHLVAAVETEDGETVQLSVVEDDDPFGEGDPF